MEDKENTKLFYGIINAIYDLGRGHSGEDGCMQQIYTELRKINKTMLISSFLSKQSKNSKESIKEANKFANAVIGLEDGSLDSVWEKELQ